MTKKFQVFISSTYIDLVKQRQAVTRATLKLGHIPVGMEMFNAGDETQWRIITRAIDECDFYAVIIAHRYGSKKRKKSYTQLEYEYAKKAGIPVMAFVIKDDAEWPAKYIDKSDSDVTPLNEFKKLAKKNKMAQFWENENDLESVFITSFVSEMKIHDRIGWVRADNLPSGEMGNELSRLSAENATMREKIKEILPLSKASSATYSKFIKKLKEQKIDIDIRYAGTHEWEHNCKRTLWQLFCYLSENLHVNNNETGSLSQTLATTLASPKKRADRQNSATYPLARNNVLAWFKQLEAVGLLSNIYLYGVPTEKWTITNEGRELYSFVLRKKILGSLKL